MQIDKIEKLQNQKKMLKVKIAKTQKCQIIEPQIYKTAKLHYLKL